MSTRRGARASGLIAAGLAAVLLGASGQAQKHATAPEVELSTMIAFEASSFTMGVEDLPVAPYGDWWFVDQQPAHEVQLSAFYLDRHEVSVAQFALFLTHAAGAFHFHPDQPIERVAGGYLPRAERDQHPINYVSWQAAHHYCLWAGKRLPTEAEWERAAAGIEGRAYPWGDEGSSCDRASYFTGSSYCQEGPLAVGQRPDGLSPDGIDDLGGNVAEWVADYYDPYPAEPQQDPSGPEQGIWRVVRGGGHLDVPGALQTRTRRAADPNGRSANIGFRCAFQQPKEDGALRGSVLPAADEDREASDRPLAPPAAKPEQLAAGLLDPVAIASLQGAYFVLARGASAIVVLDDSGATKPLIEGLDAPTDLTSDQNALFVTEATSVRRVTADGNATTIATGQNAPKHIVADDNQVVWASADGITGAVDTQVELIATLTGLTGLALFDGNVYYSCDGSGQDPKSIGRVALSGGAPQVLVAASQLPSGHVPADVAVAADGSVYYLYKKSGWPTSGRLCLLAPQASTPSCSSHSPAGPYNLRLTADGRVLWTGQRVLVTLSDAGDNYQHLAPWTRVGGLLASASSIVWTDRHDGRVYQLTAP